MPRSILDSVRDLWRDLRSRGPRADLGPDDVARVRRQLEECIQARGGEASAGARTVELARTYLQLSDGGRETFLALVAAEFGTPEEAALEAARLILDAPGPQERAEAARAARALLAPPWLKLLTEFNLLPTGTKFLVDLRADLLRLERTNPALAPLEDDLHALLTSWFDVGFLELRRITWDSPASLLEKLADSEAVHEVSSWADLKNRLEPDRRFFAFFHPQLPDEPLIFVEVALVEGLAREIAPLLDPAAPQADLRRADTAVFYSISSAQAGLAGISFGGFLIKRVVDELSVELPRLRTYATLSPAPGFRAWLESRLAAGPELLREAEVEALEPAGGAGALTALVASTAPDPASPVLAAARPALTRLCAAYLLDAKRPDGRALDPVANFHLANGARVERLNWQADPGVPGMRASLGLMVNYLYDLGEIEANHERYAGERAVAAASAVARLVREGRG